jgi:hypothetical protein
MGDNHFLDVPKLEQCQLSALPGAPREHSWLSQPLSITYMAITALDYINVSMPPCASGRRGLYLMNAV